MKPENRVTLVIVGFTIAIISFVISFPPLNPNPPKELWQFAAWLIIGTVAAVTAVHNMVKLYKGEDEQDNTKNSPPED